MASVFRETATVCKSQWFLFRLRPDVFTMRSLWVSLVFILFIAVSVFRVAHRATRKTDAVFFRFLSKAHPAAPYNIQGSYNSLSSVFRLLLIEAITLPFHRQKSKYSLSIFLSPRSIFCNNRLFRNFFLSPSTLYGPTL